MDEEGLLDEEVSFHCYEQVISDSLPNFKLSFFLF